MKTSTWKRILCTIIAGITAASLLAGCGDKTAAPPDASQSGNNVQNTGEASAPSSEKKPEDFKATLTMWGWDDKSAANSFPLFNKVYPNIKFEYVGVKDFLKKVQTSVAAGTELPDIVWENMAERGALNELNILEDLSKAPYNLDTNLIFDFGLATVTDTKGQITGIPWDMSIGGLAYRKDIAKQYLGTDDPIELAKLMPTWDSLVEKGKEVKEKSSGKVFMFSGPADVAVIKDGQYSDLLFDGNKVNVTKGIKPVVELIAKMRDAGIIDKMQQWSPAWNSAIANGSVMFFPCPLWGPMTIIGSNDTEGIDKWGLMEAPEGGFSWGGTAMGINKESKNKDAAWEFIKWFLMSKDGAKYNKEQNQYLLHYKPAFDDPDYKSVKQANFGEQDLGKMYIDVISPKTKLRGVSKYDASWFEITNQIYNTMATDKNFTVDAAMKKIEEESNKKFKDLTLE